MFTVYVVTGGGVTGGGVAGGVITGGVVAGGVVGGGVATGGVVGGGVVVAGGLEAHPTIVRTDNIITTVATNLTVLERLTMMNDTTLLIEKS